MTKSTEDAKRKAQEDFEAWKKASSNNATSETRAQKSSSTAPSDVTDVTESSPSPKGPSERSRALREFTQSVGSKTKAVTVGTLAAVKEKLPSKARPEENTNMPSGDVPVTPEAESTEEAVTVNAEPAQPGAFSTAWARMKDVFTRRKKTVILSGIGALLLIFVVIFITRFEFVTTAQGIETTLGSSENRLVLIDTSAEAQREDLVVAVLPGQTPDAGQQLLMGSVFSMNDQTFALYDGEVIWQIPLQDVKGVVVFAEATEMP